MKFIKSSLDKKFVQRKLVFKLRLFYVIFFAMLSIITYDLYVKIISFPMVLLGFGLGLIIGFAVGSISNVLWHEEKGKVVTKLDWTGGIVLFLYLSFSISRSWIFGHWIHGEELPAFCFSMVAGIMLGRLITTRAQVKSILREKGHLKSLKK